MVLRRKRAGRVAVLAALISLSTATSAHGAVTLGATDADFAASGSGVGCAQDPCSIFQDAHPLGRTSVAPFDGIVVRWRIRVQGLIAAQNATTTLRLIGPVTSPLPWGAAGPSLDVPNAEALPATISQDLRLGIVRGQGIAPQFQNLSGGNVFVSHRTDIGGTVRTINSPPPPGGSGDGNSSAMARFLAVAADVETDADADGFGDETQDACPTDATTQGSCPPPPPGDVSGPGLSWCGKEKQNLVKAGALRTCVNTDELAAVESSGVLTIGRRERRAKPIALVARRGGAAPGVPAFLDLKLNRRARGRVEDALDEGKPVTGDVLVTGTDAAGNVGQVTGAVTAKSGGKG